MTVQTQKLLTAKGFADRSSALDEDPSRGSDVVHIRYSRPKGQTPREYSSNLPELTVVVKAPSDRITAVLRKVIRHLDAGAVVVVVVDPDTKSVGVFTQNELPRRISNGDELTLPELFPDFRVPVRQFFA
jgi:Uma2 family endonuclease